MFTLASYWFVPALINVVVTAYLCWKMSTGGLLKNIMNDPKYGGENAVGGLLAVLLYIGFSIGLALIAIVVYGICSVLLVLATIGALANGLAFAAAWSVLVLVGTPWMLANAWREYQK